jgi:hypothetical protein
MFQLGCGVAYTRGIPTFNCGLNPLNCVKKSVHSHKSVILVALSLEIAENLETGCTRVPYVFVVPRLCCCDVLYCVCALLCVGFLCERNSGCLCDLFILKKYEGVSKSFRTESNEMYAYNNKHSLISNTEGYGGKTH